MSKHAVSLVNRLHRFRVAAAIGMMPPGENFVEAVDLALSRIFGRAQNGIINLSWYQGPAYLKPNPEGRRFSR